MIEKIAIIILFGSGIYHVLMGLLSMCSLNLIKKAVGVLYKLNIDNIDPKLEYAVKPLGAFAFVFGLLSFAAIYFYDDRWTRIIVALTALLFFLRAALRWIYRVHFEKTFSVSRARNLFNIGFNLALVLLLLLFVSSF
jgi:hypothetical protein